MAASKWSRGSRTRPARSAINSCGAPLAVQIVFGTSVDAPNWMDKFRPRNFAEAKALVRARLAAMCNAPPENRRFWQTRYLACREECERFMHEAIIGSGL